MGEIFMSASRSSPLGSHGPRPGSSPGFAVSMEHGRANPAGRQLRGPGLAVPEGWACSIGLTLGRFDQSAVGFRNGLATVVQSRPSFRRSCCAARLGALTWVFFEMDPSGLVFACLASSGSAGPHQAWGPHASDHLPALADYGVSCLPARLSSPSLMGSPRRPLALVSGLIIAWAMLHPHGTVFVYFVLPLRGRI
jgi:hypothetical protein